VDEIERRNQREVAILKGAIESANEAFVTIGEDHRVLLFNQAAEKILGYRADEVIGQDLSLILGPNCPRNHRASVDRYIATGQGTQIGHETELLPARKNGQTFPASISFSVARVDGRMFFTAIIRDLTEKKAYEAKIMQAERLAALGQLVAEVSHEIKNPLMMIGGFARQLLKSPQQGKDQAKIEVIVAEVGRLEGLLKELNEFYLPRKLNLERLDLNALVREARDLTGDLCEKQGIAFDLRLAEGPLLVLGDPDRLKQVMLNLIKNSIEALGNQGALTLETVRLGNRVEVRLTDNGPGMSPEILAQIFDPFFTTKKTGTGLGLPLSKKIIEEHEGASFALESREGQGTTVRVSMPALPANPGPTKG